MNMTTDESHEDDWEYEYSTTETEIFYIDIDLSSVNGVLKSQSAGNRRTLNRSGAPNQNDGVKSLSNHSGADAVPAVETLDNQDENEDNFDEERVETENAEPNSPSQAQSPREPGLLDTNYAGRLQVLDLDTTNPIISYNGGVYSCTWYDMLGTTLFVSKHQEAPFHEPEISTDDYDLIGASGIKLVGHRAKVVPKTSARKRRREEEEEEEDAEEMPTTTGFQQYVPDGRSLGTIKRTNPKTNIHIKQQANFLEKLMEIKKSRGETDTVRTFVDRGTVLADARQERKAKKAAQAQEKQRKREQEETPELRLRREINELNKRVVKGDNAALERLQEIYADLEEAEDEEDEDLIGGNTSSSAPVIANNLASTGNDAGHLHDPAGGGNVVTTPHVADSDPNGVPHSAPLH